MAQVAIIIGNGFDLDLGLKTRYSDFMKSPEFKLIYKNLFWSVSSDYKYSISILKFLEQKSQLQNWFDMEVAIYDYISGRPLLSYEESKFVENEFVNLKCALCDYLERISSYFKVNTDKLSYKLLTNMPKSKKSVTCINFNYTNPYHLLLDLKLPNTYIYVHGSLKEKDIVLGCDIQTGEKVNRPLSFMYKYNMLKRPNYIAKNLREAREVIFFGHSVNEMDFCYFRDFFESASTSPEPIRNLTFITLDENSERDIKDNIRNQGVSVTDLYSNLSSLEFIYTKRLYDGDKNEKIKWKNMWKSLFGKDVD